ncbi:hypothetical protein LMH87_011940 [Akanthomyces muscarius]|uniref:Meiotic recombination protein DMC1 n=1 Tax=Akanthomyces muscarius TaxID=2231603 RepID=A0A9W8QA46_AKAMU|nr:hypothetical protein LMH87_011940 [Akanthomyces muscarius]KAJ4151227.1 hypothetical protein LMH87_011940 [Akanthomyces muscarius]
MEDELTPQSGGFIPPTGLLSPTLSTASSRGAAALPHPRQRALNPGGSKEDIVRRYVEETLLDVSRRYVKKFSGSDPDDGVAGYTSFIEVAKQLEEVVDMLWRSGTPFLQIPFLLKIGGDFTQYVRSFPAAPRATFHLLDKMDHCFASLLCGQDVETQEALPGFENGLRGGMTTTDMVRCRSLVETTRVLMVEIMSNDTGEDEDEDEDDNEDEDDDDDDDELGLETTANRAEPKERVAWDPDQDRIHLDAARVYEKTIVQLGNRLGDGALGSA